MTVIKVAFFSLLLICGCLGAKIIGIFHAPSPSHHILGSALLKALAERGHEVTMVSPYPFKTPVKNYRDVFLKEMIQFKKDKMQKMLKPNISMVERVPLALSMAEDMLGLVRKNEDMQKLRNENFDLVIQMIMISESFLGFADEWQAPVIGFSTVGSIHMLNKYTGNTLPWSYVPNVMVPLPSEMTFLQRVKNVVSIILSHIIIKLMDHAHYRAYNKYFPNGTDLDILISNVSLVFTNSHISIESPRPYVPNLIPIGGFHIQDPKPLPKELQDYLDGATNGAVFFCLGSNVKISEFSNTTITTIMNSLGKLPMRVLFKTEVPIPNAPDNIKFDKWLPQNDVLAHPNVKLFISHGGLLSTTEAVYHGVPIVGLPVFGDQDENVAVAVAAGYALKVDLNTITEEEFSSAIQKILHNPKYRDNIELRSSLLRDQPIKPMDKAIFWVEHVLKHRGAKHLQNAGVKLAWYQYFLIDVFAFLFLILVMIVLICRWIIKLIVRSIRKLFGRSKRKSE